MKKLGILGGLGPMATAYFFQLIIQMTQAETDQEHIESIIYNCPSIPDRTQFILKKSTCSPLPSMMKAIQKLVGQGVDICAIPCITAHYFHQELTTAVSVPVVHGIEETASYLKQRNIKKAGIMATDGTVQTMLFSREFEKKGITCIYPSALGQSYIMELIYKNIKAGLPVEIDKFHTVSEELYASGAEVILLGCTELSMIKKDFSVGSGCLDVMEVLAKCCVEMCGAHLNTQYNELIT